MVIFFFSVELGDTEVSGTVSNKWGLRPGPHGCLELVLADDSFELNSGNDIKTICARKLEEQGLWSHYIWRKITRGGEDGQVAIIRGSFVDKFWTAQWKVPQRKTNALNPALSHYIPFPSNCLILQLRHTPLCGRVVSWQWALGAKGIPTNLGWQGQNSENLGYHIHISVWGQRQQMTCEASSGRGGVLP